MKLTGRIAAVVVVIGGCGSTPAVSPVSTSGGLTTTTTTAAPLRAIILDYSPTVSDVGALAFLASHPETYLIAVTVVGTGQTGCEPGVAMTRGVLEFLGRSEVAVACGQTEPIDGLHSFPETHRLVPSRLGVELGDPNSDRGAAELIADLVRTSPAPVEIVTLGPLTNLAVAFAVDPLLPGLLGGITIMGGALDVAGNAPDGVAEWNMWVDPVAASDVLRSGAPITLVPLDATSRVPTGRVFWEALDGNATTAAARLVRDLWEADGDWWPNLMESHFFWDELTAAVLVDPSLVIFSDLDLVVDLAPEVAGRTRVDPAGSAIRVAITARRLPFELLFLETLTGTPVDLDY